MKHYTPEEIEKISTELKINISTRIESLLRIWDYKETIITAIIIHFQGSYDETDAYLGLMDDGEVDHPELAWEVYCDINNITHEIDNNPFKTTMFYEYQGDGLYYVGVYGIGATLSISSLISALENDYDTAGEELAEETMDYDSGEGSLIWVQRLDEESLGEADSEILENEDLFAIMVIEAGENIPVDMIQLAVGQTAFGTDHSIFGSGNVQLRHQLKIK